MISGNITRTFFTLMAKGYVIEGLNDDGTPKLNEVYSDYFITTNKNDQTQAKRAIKKLYPNVLSQTVSVVVLDEQVRSMSLQSFYDNSETVEREANGRIK